MEQSREPDLVLAYVNRPLVMSPCGEGNHDWFKLLFITSCFKSFDGEENVIMASREMECLTDI